MKINSIAPKELYYQFVYAKEKPSIPAAAKSGTDKVELTDQAKTFSATLKAAKEAMSADNSAHASRIESIKQQIQNGTYNVPGIKVAEKILGK